MCSVVPLHICLFSSHSGSLSPHCALTFQLNTPLPLTVIPCFITMPHVPLFYYNGYFPTIPHSAITILPCLTILPHFPITVVLYSITLFHSRITLPHWPITCPTVPFQWSIIVIHCPCSITPSHCQVTMSFGLNMVVPYSVTLPNCPTTMLNCSLSMPNCSNTRAPCPIKIPSQHHALLSHHHVRIS